MWGSSKYDRELNVVTRIFQTALTQHGGHDKRESGKNEFSPCDVNITKMTADQVTNYMKGNEINVQMSRFNYFTSSGGAQMSLAQSAILLIACCAASLCGLLTGVGVSTVVA